MIKGISVVIPNFNGVALFPVTLPTVELALQNAGMLHEIILVDDCSTDNSVNYLTANFPSIKIVSNTVNSGFSKSANKGVHHAQYDKVLILNSDVMLTPNYFYKLYEKYFDKENTFGVMGRIVGWDDEIIQDGAKYPVFQGSKIKTSTNYLLKDEKLMANGLYSMYLSGANAFIDKEKFIEIGGFNEMFSPFYVEDYELSVRAWRLGYYCYYDYNAVCRHKTSTTIKKESKKAFVDIIYDRNKMYLHELHLQGMKKYIWYLQLFLEGIFRLLTFKWGFITSIKYFFQTKSGLTASKHNFTSIAKKRGVCFSLPQVATFIIDDLKGKEVIKV